MDYDHYRRSESEQLRTADLLRLIPKDRGRSALDIGARDGHFSKLLTQYYEQVALDLTQPQWSFDRVTTVAGDVTNLEYPDKQFDLVFCVEVLEHVPQLAKACSEIQRVSRDAIIIGVPFEQDTRVGRNTCQACGRISPPYGHINTFTKNRLLGLFSGLVPEAISFVATNNDATTPLAAMLMDIGGNPWGTYEQEEPCIHCGAKLVAPTRRPFWKKVASGVAVRMNAISMRLARPHANWIHILFRKRAGAQTSA
jgi:ubiquinone/menaquinone biosynthesis C-methylase UbiE